MGRDAETLSGIWYVSLPISSEFQAWVVMGIWCQDGMCIDLDIKKTELLGDWKWVGTEYQEINTFFEEGCFNKTFIIAPASHTCNNSVRLEEMPYGLLCFYLDSNPSLRL